MNIKFNLTGEDRKKLVKAISEITGIPAEYQYMPTCSYIIGNCTVTKDGTLIISDDTDEKEVQNLLSKLEQMGYSAASDNSKLTVQMPRDSLDERTLNRVRRILENKGELFKTAFKTDSVEFQVTEKTVDFPWFTVEQDGDAEAYSTFISMLCEFARNQKRINYKPDTSDNPKYSFRCFLIRLGMVGTEFKATRKVLLRNLSGSSAFRHGGVNDAVSE
ncbi:MAG: virulence protein [Ruminococcus flavefaciens]|nr:virulence protein [Ruminococcus flavefaciens]MCM1062592.1 virulence protein [Eubacterium sp.]